MININRYDEFGIPAASNIGRFGYTGQAWLPEFGLNYYKARMYSPTLGRFMQTDPIGYSDGINWYNYVGGDPVNGRDPSGMIANRGDFAIDSPFDCAGNRTSSSCSGGSLLDNIDAMSANAGAKKQSSGAGKGGDSNGNGHLSFGEANEHYRNGGGTSVVVDASKLTVTLDQVPTKSGQTVSSTVNGSDFLVHGKVNVTLQGDGSYRVVDGKYDFDISSRRDAVRNAATAFGYGVATQFQGGGTDFLIRYRGSPNVRLPFAERSYDRCAANPGRC